MNLTWENYLKESEWFLQYYIELERDVSLRGLTVSRVFYLGYPMHYIEMRFSVEKFKQKITVGAKFHSCDLPEQISKRLINKLDGDVKDNLFLYKYGELTHI